MLARTWTAIWFVGSEHGTELSSQGNSKNGIINTLLILDATTLFFGGHEGANREYYASEVSD